MVTWPFYSPIQPQCFSVTGTVARSGITVKVCSLPRVYPWSFSISYLIPPARMDWGLERVFERRPWSGAILITVDWLNGVMRYALETSIVCLHVSVFSVSLSNRMYFYLPVCLCVCLPVCLSICVWLSAVLSGSLSSFIPTQLRVFVSYYLMHCCLGSLDMKRHWKKIWTSTLTSIQII